MSNQPGVLIKDVAESLCIHPFMLSVAQAGARWRARWQASAAGGRRGGGVAAAARSREAVQAPADGA